MIQTRSEFKQWIETMFPEKSMSSDKSAVWIPEHDLTQTKCGWFVTVKPVRASTGTSKPEYWTWCNKNLQGHVRCFWSNSDDGEEIWGFTDRNDIHWWMLKWSV